MSTTIRKIIGWGLMIVSVPIVYVTEGARVMGTLTDAQTGLAFFIGVLACGAGIAMIINADKR